MAGSTDRGGGRGRAGRSAFGLGQFDLHILDSGHRQQGLAGLGRDAVTLAGSETRQGQFEDGPGPLAPQPPDPAELQQAASTAGIPQLAERRAEGIDVLEGGLGIGSLVWGGHPLLGLLGKGGS
jgi:hypothetical protein